MKIKNIKMRYNLEIHQDGEKIMWGDNASMEVIFNNISGKNNIDNRGQYLKFVCENGGFEMGKEISLIEIDTQFNIAKTLRSAIIK
jgi:hypothetical protein